MSATLNRATSTIAGHNYGSGRAGGYGGAGVLQVQWIGGQADQEFMTWLKRNIRIRGGQPGVLGR